MTIQCLGLTTVALACGAILFATNCDAAEWKWTTEKDRMSSTVYYEKTMDVGDFNIAIQCQAYQSTTPGTAGRFYKIIFGTKKFLGEGAHEGVRFTRIKIGNDEAENIELDYTDHHAQYLKQGGVAGMLMRLKESNQLLVELLDFRSNKYMAEYNLKQPETSEANGKLEKSCMDYKP